jgi:hypothetical protein
VMDATERRDDAELVAGVLAGDREAFGPLLARWRPSVLGCAGGRSAQARRLRTSPTRGGALAVHGAAEAGLAGRYAAAKAMEDTDLMELYLTDLFPEEEVDGCCSRRSTNPECGWRWRCRSDSIRIRRPRASAWRRQPKRSSDCWLSTAPRAEDGPIGGVDREAGEAPCA